jgi:hypothetical protein
MPRQLPLPSAGLSKPDADSFKGPQRRVAGADALDQATPSKGGERSVSSLHGSEGQVGIFIGCDAGLCRFA